VNPSEYNPFIGYAQSKTANILFTTALRTFLKPRGIKTFALNPGAINTGLQKHVTKEMYAAGLRVWESMGKKAPERKSLKQGCSTTLRAALDPGLEVGENGEGIFLMDCQFVGIGEDLAGFAVDEENAKRCWEVSEGMVGQKFDLSVVSRI
jgi:NAD(P)-dependent dehydrogenase (short-subunit alcohol dehydrogenase family)